LQVASVKDCARLKGARLDLWHADGQGMYSGYRGQGDNGISTRGETFLRGTQFTDADGQVRFATIYPGWYPGRTPHIHLKVFLDAANLVTGQLYFPDDLSARIYVGITPTTTARRSATLSGTKRTSSSRIRAAPRRW
jgi:protocatechuate 3,4-dioxygenase beta subunit